jgi:arginyl-tRNA synthetase
LIRYKQLHGEKIELPEDSYHGEEIIDVAKIIKNDHKDKFMYMKVIEEKSLEGKQEDIEFIKAFSKDYLLDIIKQTLIKFDVKMDI